MGIFFRCDVNIFQKVTTSEATAMSSIGMGIKEIVKPIFILACATTLFIFFLQESIIPSP